MADASGTRVMLWRGSDDHDGHASRDRESHHAVHAISADVDGFPSLAPEKRSGHLARDVAAHVRITNTLHRSADFSRVAHKTSSDGGSDAPSSDDSFDGRGSSMQSTSCSEDAINRTYLDSSPTQGEQQCTVATSFWNSEMKRGRGPQRDDSPFPSGYVDDLAGVVLVHSSRVETARLVASDLTNVPPEQYSIVDSELGRA